MARLLWLAFEQPPHPDAVCHPATVDDVLFVLELLESTVEHRTRVTSQLRKYLEQQRDCEPWSRPSVPCRRESGMYSLIPWRLALWLASILPATASVIDRTRGRLERWLQDGHEKVMNPLAMSR